MKLLAKTELLVAGLAAVLALAPAGAAHGSVGRSTQASAPDSKPEGAAEKLYVSKCAKCHKFYDPAKYSDAQWAKWMGKMGKKAKLSPQQQRELSGYIQERYRSGASPR